MLPSANSNYYNNELINNLQVSTIKFLHFFIRFIEFSKLEIKIILKSDKLDKEYVRWKLLKHNYKVIMITYVAMQLFLSLGSKITYALFQAFGMNGTYTWAYAVATWTVISFITTLVITMYHLKDEFSLRNKNHSFFMTIGWSIYGVLLAFITQSIAITIESYLGVKTGSNNTESILSLIKIAPFMILVTTIIGPILEEVIFRKIIFGALYKKFGFFISALISSVLFSAAHMEFEHLLLYSAIGFTFSYLYVRTNTIFVPIFAHTFMNTYVVILQLLSQNMANF